MFNFENSNYIPYKVVPEVPSRVRQNICDEEIVAALDRHLDFITARNRTLAPAEVYEKACLTGPKKAV